MNEALDSQSLDSSPPTDPAAIARARHVVDTLIAERSANLARHAWWPLLRPALMRFLHYGQAVRMAADIADLPGFEAMAHLSGILSLDVHVENGDRLPASGGFILAPSHPTGIADGVAVFDMLRQRRPDMAIFANRDALRTAPGFRDIMIPVEWRPGEKSRAKSRDTLESMAKAFAAGRAIVLFPAGRIAYWFEGALTERPWQNSAVTLARRYGLPVVPANITSRNSPLFYLLSRFSTDLRDITVFHELLNKKGQTFTIRVGRPIAPEVLAGDPSEVTARLQHHTVKGLLADANAEFS